MRAAPFGHLWGRPPAFPYLVAAGAVSVALLIRLLLAGVLEEHAPLLIFVMAVVISAWYGGLYPGLFATVLGALAGYVSFLMPYQLTPGLAPHDLVRMLIYLFEGVVISLLSQLLHQSRSRANASAEQLQRLQSVMDVALGHLALDDLLNALLVRIRAALATDTAVVLLLDSATDTLVVRAAVGLEEEVAQQVHIPLGAGFAGMAAAERRPVAIPLVSQINVLSPVLRERGVQSLLGAPLVIGDQLIGMLHVGTLAPRTFSDDDNCLLQLVAERAAQAIERARLYQEARDALQQREETLVVLNTLLDRAPIGFGLFDRQLRYLRINRVLAAMSGLPAERQLGLTVRAALPGLADTVEPLLQQVLATDESLVNLELSGPAPAAPDERRSYLASYYPVRQPDGTMVGVGAITSDITARKQAELALRRSAERLAVLHAIDRAILQAQSLDVLVRAALERLRPLVHADAALVVQSDPACGCGEVVAAVGLPPDLLTGHPLVPAAAPPDGGVTLIDDLRAADSADPLLRRLCQAGYCSVLRVPLRTERTPIGHLDALARQPSSFNDEDAVILGEVAAQLAVATEQVRLRQALERHASELEQRVVERTAQLQAANADLEEFASIAAHDLRAPLRAVMGYAAIIEEDYAGVLDQAGQQYLRRIGVAARQMDQLVQDLLHYSRISRAPIALGPVPLGLAIDDALARLAGDIAARRALVLVAGPLPTVLAHGPTLVHVLANLLANATTFVAPGTAPQVQVRAETHGTDLDGAGGRVRLWVVDNGIGIAPEHQARIFHAFERLHGQESYPGSGIGLAIVRKGVERMGGQVGVVSSEGRGSQFWIDLPRAEEQLT